MRYRLNPVILVTQVAVFAALCIAGAYSNYEGFHDAKPRPDSIHARLIQYGHEPPHYVAADQFQRWQLTWAATGILIIAFVGLLWLQWRLRSRDL
ncbi:MAG: hypothetical protein ACREEB_09555 [Caulobacteraceae bacterium]